MQRIDKLLVQKGLIASRSLAQQLIRAHAVEVRTGTGWQTVTRPAAAFPEDTPLRILDHDLLRYVSRGGIKLEGALRHTGLDVHDTLCLDVGQSTGGFTDCLLQHGAAKVVGVEVGHDQLHDSLKADPRIVTLEGINARDMIDTVRPYLGDQGADLAVMDVSFISQRLVVPEVVECLRPAGHFLALVKPQFELGPEALNDKGIVRDPSRYAELETTTKTLYAEAGMTVLDWFDSPIAGGDGNREFFILARRPE
ncbi:TlyA family RNA methyltransferase [Hahella sp. SMD15-11]|uniref:TlyA family RNA methyltransferase n=1 Tax=Thermohahella caldifontis TaxID=3142973 RepID=A0AB39UYM8_9GAMM